MKKNVFTMKDFSHEAEDQGYEYRRPVSNVYKADSTGSLRAFVGDYTKQCQFEEMLNSTKVKTVNRFFELIPHYTLRENLSRSGRENRAIEQIAEELGFYSKLDDVTVHLGELDQEKAAIALAVLKRPASLGFVNTCEGLSSGEKVCYYDAILEVCRKYNVKGLLFITKYASNAVKKPIENPSAVLTAPTAVCVPA